MSGANGRVRSRSVAQDLPSDSSFPYMYGVSNFDDDPAATDYDPWEHAAMLGIPIVFRDDLPTGEMVACYSEEHGAVFVRPNLHGTVERCAVAHEIVHFEHRDVGADPAQEDRADRIAARRLIRPRRLHELSVLTDDPAVAALELGVTEKVMRTHLRMLRQTGVATRG